MKRLSIFIVLSCALLIAAKPEPSFDGSQSRLAKASDDVPGNNPLVVSYVLPDKGSICLQWLSQFCDDHLDYTLDIDYVNLEPNPPEP
jgi:hypothetical protein